MSLRVVVDAGGRLDLAEELEERHHDYAKKVVGQAAGMLYEDIRRLLRLRAGRIKSSSPAGEPPEWDTGALLASFRIIPPRVRGAVVISGIRSDHPGGNRLEHGFTDVLGVRTFPHPFLGPAMGNVDAKVNDLFLEAFD